MSNWCCDCQCGWGDVNTCRSCCKACKPHLKTISTLFQCRALIRRAPMERFLVYATISLASAGLCMLGLAMEAGATCRRCQAQLATQWLMNDGFCDSDRWLAGASHVAFCK